MAVNLSPVFNDAQLDSSGNPASGFLLFTYAAGSATKQTTYKDSAAATAHDNPIVLNARGEPSSPIWLTAGQSYKFRLCVSTESDPPSTSVRDVDNVSGVNDTATTIDEWVASGLTPTYVSATSFTLVGDQTTLFHVGRRLKIVDAGGTKYVTIRTSAYTTLTTLTIDLDAGGSLSSPLTSVSYGILAATNRSIPSGFISPSQITANQNNYAPTGYGSAYVFRLNSDARRSLTGLAGGTDGREITVHNVGTFPILFNYESGSSTAANRFAFGHTLSGGHSIKLQYDGTSARWRCTFKQDPAGTEKLFLGTTVPEGQLALDGSNVSRTTYAALFNEIGTTWGVGDGSTTFGLADSRRSVAVGTGGTGTATLDDLVGSTGGAETHTLTAGEAPVMSAASDGAHTHTAPTNTDNSTGADSGQAYETGPGTASTITTSSNGAHTHTVNSGGGGAHNNMQPSYVVTKTVVF